MEIDTERLDEVALALLYLTSFKDGPATRAWKGFDWEVLDRLHEKGFISNPRGKARSVVLTDEGARLAEQLFERFFARR